MPINVVGAGLAGSEAAWQIAQRGHKVRLFEMRPNVQTPAHQTGYFGELVCSNSLGSKLDTTAPGLLKKELQLLNSLIIDTAYHTSVPAGGALAVDREAFSKEVTERLESHPGIEIIREECTTIPSGLTVLATGPLSSPAITKALQTLTKGDNLYFYDAAAPIALGSSIHYEKGFWAARYGKGDADYFNCPLTKEEYDAFWYELTHAEEAPLHESECTPDGLKVFEGCMPIEVLARRGQDALRFGPFRPVGLEDSQGQRPYAVLQLRLENTKATLFNLVGCQTRLKWGEQKRVFRMIPALRSAEFVRYGVMHRNTFINSPQILTPFSVQSKPELFLAGQITGVEGYRKHCLTSSRNAAQLDGLNPLIFPERDYVGSP